MCVFVGRFPCSVSFSSGSLSLSAVAVSVDLFKLGALRWTPQVFSHLVLLRIRDVRTLPDVLLCSQWKRLRFLQVPELFCGNESLSSCCSQTTWSPSKERFFFFNLVSLSLFYIFFAFTIYHALPLILINLLEILYCCFINLYAVGKYGCHGDRQETDHLWETPRREMPRGNRESCTPSQRRRSVCSSFPGMALMECHLRCGVVEMCTRVSANAF